MAKYDYKGSTRIDHYQKRKSSTWGWWLAGFVALIIFGASSNEPKEAQAVQVEYSEEL